MRVDPAGAAGAASGASGATSAASGVAAVSVSASVSASAAYAGAAGATSGSGAACFPLDRFTPADRSTADSVTPMDRTTDTAPHDASPAASAAATVALPLSATTPAPAPPGALVPDPRPTLDEDGHGVAAEELSGLRGMRHVAEARGMECVPLDATRDPQPSRSRTPCCALSTAAAAPRRSASPRLIATDCN